MGDASGSGPPTTPEIDAALALVCTLPSNGRTGRSVKVQNIIACATSFRELRRGVAFSFPNADDMAQALFDFVLAERTCCAQFRYNIGFPSAHQSIRLRIEASGAFVKALQDLYVGIAREAGIMPETGGVTRAALPGMEGS